MSLYRKIKHPSGFRYMMDGKLASITKIPDHVLKVLESVDVFDSEATVVEAPRICIFCGLSTKLTRMLNSQTVYICEEHYHSMSLGKIAQKLREQTNEEAQEDQKD